MITQRRNTIVYLVGNDPKRISRSTSTATVGSISIDEASFLAQSARIRLNDLRRENLNVLPQKAICNQVQDEDRGEDIKKKELKLYNE